MLRKWRQCARSSEWLTTRRLWKTARRWPAGCVCSPPSCRPWSSLHLLGSLEMKRPISSSTLRHHSAAARCTCRGLANNARAACLLGAEWRSRAPQGIGKSSFPTPSRTNESPLETGCWTSAHSNKMPLPTGNDAINLKYASKPHELGFISPQHFWRGLYRRKGE